IRSLRQIFNGFVVHTTFLEKSRQQAVYFGKASTAVTFYGLPITVKQF
ncbi:hypothetical protein D039_4062B, partial [Vibrio parahaemolyticus EKP-028]